MADARDLKSLGSYELCEFESHSGHQVFIDGNEKIKFNKSSKISYSFYLTNFYDRQFIGTILLKNSFICFYTLQLNLLIRKSRR